MYVPVLVTLHTSTAGLIVNLVVFVFTLAFFFWSVVGLHRQMAAAKARQLKDVRALYTEAYEPIRRDGTLDAVSSQAEILNTLDKLERRVAALRTWPFDTRALAWIAGISTGVLTIVLSRLALTPLGL